MGRYHRGGKVAENQNLVKGIVVTLKKTVSKTQNYCSKGDSRTQYSSLKTLFAQRQSDESFTDPASTVELQSMNL
jgi:hypothetical protein